MKVAIAGTGTRGDMQPLLVLARALADRGITAWVCGPPDHLPVAQELGVPYRPYGPVFRDMLDGLQTKVERRPWEVLDGSAITQGLLRPQIEELPALCEGADILIGNPVLPIGASIAEAQGIPYFKAIYQAALLASDQYPPPFMRRQDLPQWLNWRLWDLFRYFMNRGFTPAINAARRDYGLAPIADMVDYILGTAHFLLACDEALVGEHPTSRWDFRVSVTGFWHMGSEHDPLPPEVTAFLDAGPPPVYVGFGSMTAKDPVERTRLLLGALRAAGQRGILHSGWAGLGRGEALGPDCLAIGAVSHAALFPRCRAIVHHGGSGTTAAAARAGRPQVVVPHLLDQFYFAHRVWKAGLGPAPIHVERLTAKRLAAAIRSAGEDQAVAARAEALGAKLQARDGLEEATAVIAGANSAVAVR